MLKHSLLWVRRAKKISYPLRVEKMNKLIDKMNKALGWELRAINMYAHYAANIKGIHRLQLSPLFNTEMTESVAHADIVRKAIIQLGGIPVTERDAHPITHTNDYVEMLNHSLDTEIEASKVYSEVLIMVEESNEEDLKDALEQIYLSELRSVEEFRLLVG